jgi:integrase
MHFIQAVMGHSSVSITEKYYAHFSPDSASRALLTVLEGGRRRGKKVAREWQIGGWKERFCEGQKCL